MRTRTLVALAAGGVVLAVVGTALVLTSDHEDNKGAFLSLALTVGLSFLASGVVALWRRPDNRTGTLLIAVAYLWFLGALTLSSNDLVFTLGILVNSFALGAFVHLLLGFPSGRLQGRRDVLIVIGAYSLVFAGSLAQLLVERRPETSCSDCESVIAVTDSDTASTVVRALVSVLALALVGTLLVIVVLRYMRARGALRRALGPVLGTGALVMLVLLLQLAVGAFSEDAAEPLYYVFLVTFALVPVAFLAGVLRSRLARSGVGNLLLELSRGTPLREALRRTLNDPALDIAYWLPEAGRYVSAEGKPLEEGDGSRSVKLVEHGGRPTAALLHDPQLNDEPELVDAVSAAAGLWLDNERLQAKLRAQIEFLETTVDTSPSLLCSLDREGRIANLNVASLRASGYADSEEARWQPFWDVFVAPEERDRSRERFQAAAPFHQAAAFEHTFVNRAGEELTIAWSTAPLTDDRGNVRNVICGGLDITERERQHRQLQASEERLRAAIEASPVAIIEVGLDDRVAMWNPAAERMFGWSREEMMGRPVRHVPPERRGELQELFERVRGGEVYTGIESTRVCKDGSVIDVEISAAPIYDPGGGVAGHLALFADISDRKRQEEELRGSEERLRAAIDASPVAIVEYGLDDTITRWNPAAKRIFGWTAQEVLGGPPKHRPPGRDEELAELFQDVQAGEVYTSVETKRRCKNGSLIDVEISTAPIFDDAGQVVSYMALYADITERKRQEEEIRASRARIVEAGDEARRRLERNLHDGAQQRLVSLSLSLRLAQSKVSADPVAAEKVLDAAREELAAALDELRELARGIHPAVLTDRGLTAALEALATRSAIPVEIETPDEELPRSVGAAAYYVIAESLANVAKYAGATHATVAVGHDNGRAVVEVADDGVGGADASAGSGLRGLSDRVEALGGTLFVDSPPGGGTRIRAEIPLQPAAQR